MSFYGKGGGSQRSERWAREDEAPRLLEVVPGLLQLRLELAEWSGDRIVLDSKRIQHIVVQRAPALFEVPCGDSGCRDGGFDVTAAVLRALRHEQPQFEGEAACFGSVGERPCQRVLRFRGLADWSQAPRDRGER